MEKKIISIVPTLILIIFLGLILSVVRASVFSQVEEEKHIYFEIVFLLLLSAVGELAVNYLKIPSVMILMILGIFLSHSFIDFTWDQLKNVGIERFFSEKPQIIRLEEIIQIFASFGAVVLLFKVGLHNKIENIFTKENFLVAVLGVVVPFIVGYLYATVTGGNFAYSMFLAAALTATSVGVTVAILKEAKLIEEKFAQIIIGAAVIDDVLGLLVLSAVLNVSGGNFELGPIITTFLSAIVFISGAILCASKVIEYLDSKELNSRRFILVLCLMLFFAYVAEFIKLSAIVGAFIAGLIINQSRHSKEIEDKIYGLEILFMPIFFISLGSLIDIQALGQYMIPILIISTIAIISKLVPCYIGAIISKLNQKESILVGLGMSPRGEVALIVASLGLFAGALNSAQYSIISAMALITTFIVPPIMNQMIKQNK
jgi:Kef-type K+ transport system membrane component KefB